MVGWYNFGSVKWVFVVVSCSFQRWSGIKTKPDRQNPSPPFVDAAGYSHSRWEFEVELDHDTLVGEGWVTFQSRMRLT